MTHVTYDQLAALDNPISLLVYVKAIRQLWTANCIDSSFRCRPNLETVLKLILRTDGSLQQTCLSLFREVICVHGVTQRIDDNSLLHDSALLLKERQPAGLQQKEKDLSE